MKIPRNTTIEVGVGFVMVLAFLLAFLVIVELIVRYLNG